MNNSLHISIASIKSCKNLFHSFGMICVKCNKCGRFNNQCCICKKILTPKNKKIAVEFVDIFEIFACKEHERLIEKYGGKYMEDYKQYMIYKSKKAFMTEINKIKETK